MSLISLLLSTTLSPGVSGTAEHAPHNMFWYSGEYSIWEREREREDEGEGERGKARMEREEGKKERQTEICNSGGGQKEMHNKRMTTGEGWQPIKMGKKNGKIDKKDR